MKLNTPFSVTFFILFFLLLSYQKNHSQCFQIESILVDACGVQEGFNEMVRFKVGNSALNVSNLSVGWATTSLDWQGLVQNSTTQSIVNTLNGDILDAGGCGELLQPINGILPANATVILVTSFNMDTDLNSFGALTEDIYILFQNNPDVATGHFANSGTGTRTLTMNFGGCSDTVTYNRASLINPDGTAVPADGAIVNFNPSGTATYINNDCSAPVTPFTVDVPQSSLSACAGNIITLNGNAQGQESISWTAANGNFSSPNALSTNYTIPSNAAGTTIVLTLTATNSCDLSIADTVNVIVTPSVVPTFNPIATICFGQTLAPLPTTSNNGITGTWSPALNNSSTTTYTFTPNAGQCATTATLTITVNPADTVPTFTAVPQICFGQALAPLPTTSNNGITGTWSPALNNSATTTYTFTPNAGQCATTATLTIMVNPADTVPVFTAVTPICFGQTLAPLPTTSNNGITGSWSPTLNNSATTTYTFTPNAGQCATTATLTITVNPADTVPVFSAVTPICFGQTLAPLPTTSNNEITGSWSPALNNSATTTYTFTPNAGQCATTSTLTITVNNLVDPTFTSVTPICQGETLSALPVTSNNGIIGTWSPALNNLATTTYTFTPNTGQCASTASLIITVNTPIIPTFTTVAPICLGETLSTLPLTSNNGIIGTWSPALNNSATTTYTFTPTTGQCANTTTMTIIVNTPIIPTFTAVTPICLGGNLSALPLTSNNGIIGTWSPALNNSATTTYTFTPNAGQCATTTTLTITVNPANTVPVFTAVPSICFSQALGPLPTTSNNGITGTWSPALNNSATTTYTFTPNTGQCGTITTLTITVNNLVVPTFASVVPICQGETLSALPLTSNNGIIGTWSPALNNLTTTTYTFTPNVGQCASTATLIITVNTPIIPTFTAVAPICLGENLATLPTISNNGITGTWSPALNNSATTTYTFTPTTGQCANTTTMTIIVDTPIVPTFTTVAPICLGENLTTLPTISNNGITGSWSPALNNSATTTYTFTPTTGQCATTTTLTIIVNTINVVPVFTVVAPICSGQAIAPLPTTSNNGITGTWSPAINNSATTNYTFTPNAGQCAVTTTMTIMVNTSIVPLFTAVTSICEGENLSPLPTTSNNGITGTWSPALNNTATTTYTFTPNAGQCGTSTTLTITITDKITPVFTISSIFCIGSTPSDLDNVSDNGVSGTWNPSVITSGGNYVFTPAADQCALPYTLTVTASEFDFKITEGCVNGAFLLQASPLSDSFDPDAVSYQWKNSSGTTIGSDEKELDVTALLHSTPETEEFPITYELTITNDSGCFKTHRIEIFGAICKIPKGISPNNDGDNDDWDLTGFGVKHVTIFNRYGTEVFTHRNYTNQWKGQSNKGDELPDATYFYVIEQENGKNLSGWVYINKAY